MGYSHCIARGREDWERYFDNKWTEVLRSEKNQDEATKEFRRDNKLLFCRCYERTAREKKEFLFEIQSRKAFLGIRTGKDLIKFIHKTEFDAVISQMNELFRKAEKRADEAAEATREVNLSINLRPSTMSDTITGIAWLEGFVAYDSGDKKTKQHNASWYGSSNTMSLLRYQNGYNYEFEHQMTLLPLIDYALCKFIANTKEYPGSTMMPGLREFVSLFHLIQKRAETLKTNLMWHRYTDAFKIL